MSLLAPNNARIQTVSRASAGEVDRYGVHKNVVAITNLMCRLDLSPRVGFTSDGQEVTIDATIIVSAPSELLPGDIIKMDMEPENQYRVVSRTDNQDHLGVPQFGTCSGVRQR